MRNITKIWLRDARAVFTNVVALVVVIGLAVIPSLYAWFNINSNWDPYGEDATGNLTIAVYSADKGLEISGVGLNIGDAVISALHENHTIGWVFPEDERHALNGVYSGDYYAALVIPETFTSDVLGIVDGNFDGGTMYYYENEKKNAIATKITGKAKTAVENQINATVMSTIAEIVATAARASEFSGSAVLFNNTVTKIESVRDSVTGYIEMIDVIMKTMEAGEETLESVTGLNDKIIEDLRIDLTLLAGLSSELSVSGLQLANLRMQDYIALLTQAGNDLGEIRDILGNLTTDIDNVLDGIGELRDSQKLADFMELMQNDPEQIAVFFSTPVDIETQAIFPIKNYGSQMASFYTVLALWFGSLILVAIIHTGVHPFGGIKKFKTYQQFFGRYLIFFVIGQVQTVIVVLGDLYFAQIQCEHKFLFWLISAVSSFAFTMLIYALTFAFGNVGEALAVVVMVIQVAGAGGTFPKEVLPAVYRSVYSYMPFTYAMDGMKEAIGGLYGNTYLLCIAKQFAVIAISIAVGFLGRFIFEPMNHLMESAKEKTGIMI